MGIWVGGVGRCLRKGTFVCKPVDVAGEGQLDDGSGVGHPFLAHVRHDILNATQMAQRALCR